MVLRKKNTSRKFQKYLLLFIISLLFLIIFCECINYPPVRFSKTIQINSKFYGTNAKVFNINEKKFYIHSINPKFEKSYPFKEKGNKDKIFLKRYFAEVFLQSPMAKINNKAVEYALSGKFKEAKVIFEEVIKEDNNFAPAYNNLGIIFELFYNLDDAYKMYSMACMIDPENVYYRRNFLYAQDSDKKKN